MPMIGRRFYPGLKRGAMGFMQSGDFPVPVAHYKLGKNTGAVAYDSSPEGNDGTIHGATWAKGYLGPGLYFDFIDDYVECPNTHQNRITVAAWVKRDGSQASHANVVSQAYTSRVLPYYEFGITIYPGNRPRFIVTIDEVNYECVSAGAIPDLTWTFLAGVYDGEYVRLYINGEAETPTAGAGDIDDYGQSLFMGHWQHATTIDFKGTIDEVIVFDEVLTAAQVRELYLGYR